jgi:hypothetical protein
MLGRFLSRLRKQSADPVQPSPPVVTLPARWGGVYRIVELTLGNGAKRMEPQRFLAGSWYGPGEYFYVPPEYLNFHGRLEEFLDQRWQEEQDRRIISMRQVAP